MGCDIHLHVERRTDAGWERIPSDGDGDGEGDNLWDTRHWYSGRNYKLFAILADVRNNYGFAGTYTGERLNPITSPRGLPADVSREVQEESDYWDCDGHDHSYLTVAEILAYDWDQTAILTRLVNDVKRGDLPEGGHAEKVQKFADTYGELPPWVGDTCSGVSGPDEYVRQWVEVTWKQPYYRCPDRDWWGTVTRAARLSKGSFDDVRFVFWFDN
jgi:hypothetical protein